ncbi:MAG: hypothetical protein LCH81_14045 [Bacteroidetes bacterium]|nr:hypothetical protein [Bacteroidota bacterium]
MKQTVTVVLLLLLTVSTQAQDAKQKLGFIPYADPGIAKSTHREMAYKTMYEAATRIFINTQRFDVLDRGKFNILKIEQTIQKKPELINSEIIRQGRVLAAQVLVVAEITAFSVTPSADKKGWSAFLVTEIKQLDVESSKALAAVQLKGEYKDLQGSPDVFRAGSADQAVSKVVDKLEKDLEKWIHSSFPIQMQILTESWEKNNTQHVIYARGGKNMGLTPRNKMCLRRVRKLSSGDIVVETIAELKLTIDGIGETTTKYELKAKKDWPAVERAQREFQSELFVMECSN